MPTSFILLNGDVGSTGMRRVQIDFGSPPRSTRPKELLFLGLLVAAFVGSALYYRHLLATTATLTAQYRTESESRGPSRAVSAAADKNKIEVMSRWQSAHLIVDRLSIPWQGFFNALEKAATDDVSLLRVEPDAVHREVRLTVQTLKLADSVAYARRLMTSGALTSATIVSQRDMTSDTHGLIQVIISAKWAADTKPSSPENAVNLSADQPRVAARTW